MYDAFSVQNSTGAQAGKVYYYHKQKVYFGTVCQIRKRVPGKLPSGKLPSENYHPKNYPQKNCPHEKCLQKIGIEYRAVTTEGPRGAQAPPKNLNSENFFFKSPFNTITFCEENVKEPYLSHSRG